LGPALTGSSVTLENNGAEIKEAVLIVLILRLPREPAREV